MTAASAVPVLAAEFGVLASERLGDSDGEAFRFRIEQFLPDAVQTLTALYGDDLTGLVRTLLTDVLDRAEERREPLRALDRVRAADPGWFQSPRMVGYVCYADRFARNLPGVRSRLDYLAELGVSYLHLMPVLSPRPGENDGGYAVVDYESIDPRLGTMEDLSELAEDLHGRGIALCIDLVLNHTAREHEWARKAIAGDAFYRDFYLIYPDRSAPDEFEQTVPDIFPDLAPGSFTHVAELDGWVWTTFREFQWDLNYANPAVFRAILNTMLLLANQGVDVLRLDAAPFLWKRPGTDCQDQPEAHLVLQAFRALTRIAAPGLLLKAEAMLAPDLLGKYLGDHGEYRPECDLAYDNQLMVMLWSAAATGDSRLASQALSRRRPAPAAASWVSYVRCHDDIGWAVTDTDAEAVGLDGVAHRRFLSDFYAGDVAASFARGARFQINELGASPTSGTAASLAGIEAALTAASTAEALLTAERRLELLYSLVFSFGGIPLIYMGDELALLNDPGWERDAAHHGDNRWMHRPLMDWKAAAQRGDSATVPGRVFSRMRQLALVRGSQASLRSNQPVTVLATDNRHLLAYRRGGAGSVPLLAIVNFAESPQASDAGLIERAGITQPTHVHSTTGSWSVVNGRIELPGCGFLWLTGGWADQASPDRGRS